MSGKTTLKLTTMTEINPYLNCHHNCEYIVRDCSCLTLKQVSDKWGIPESTLREKRTKQELPTFFKLFGRVKTHECWFKVWLNEHQLGKSLKFPSNLPKTDVIVSNGNSALVNLVPVFTPVNAIGKKLYQVSAEWNSLIT